MDDAAIRGAIHATHNLPYAIPASEFGPGPASLNDYLSEVARGDHLAFRSLYDRTRQKLFSVCLKICRDCETAEDALADTYLVAWTRAIIWDPSKASAITWLQVIARNRSIDHLRRERRVLTIPVDAVELPDPAPSPEAALSNLNTDQVVRASLEPLKSRHKKAVQASFLEERSQSEVASLQGMPASTVRSLVQRAFREMRKNPMLLNEISDVVGSNRHYLAPSQPQAE